MTNNGVERGLGLVLWLFHHDTTRQQITVKEWMGMWVVVVAALAITFVVFQSGMQPLDQK